MTGGSHASLAEDFKNICEQKLPNARETVTYKEHRTHTRPGIYPVSSSQSGKLVVHGMWVEYPKGYCLLISI